MSQHTSETQNLLDRHGRYPQAISVEDFRRNLTAMRTRIRQCFVLLRALRDRLRESASVGISLFELSTGMSDDFEIAIEEGSTVVRVGQAIFGARNFPNGHYWPTNSTTKES